MGQVGREREKATPRLGAASGFFIAPQMAVPEGHTQGLEAPHCIVWVKNRLRKIAINGPLYSRGVGVKGAVDPFFILV